MNCPVDGNALAISDRQGVEIDYCPKCRGVWLDRGELDKLIERSTEYAADKYNPAPAPQNHQEYERHSDHRDGYQNGHHKKKKESFLGDLFDF